MRLLRHIIILLFVALLIPATSMAKKPKTAKIFFEKTLIDLGDVKKNDAVKSFTIEYTNKGKADLVLTDVLPDCHCTKVSYSKEPVAPKKKGIIDVTFDGSIYFQGKMQRSIFVKSNASDNPEVEIVIECKIVY